MLLPLIYAPSAKRQSLVVVTGSAGDNHKGLSLRGTFPSPLHLTHYEPTIISAARNLALRARGFRSISCGVGVSGFGVRIRSRAL